MAKKKRAGKVKNFISESERVKARQSNPKRNKKKKK